MIQAQAYLHGTTKKIKLGCLSSESIITLP
jgi:hypothetical protein